MPESGFHSAFGEDNSALKELESIGDELYKIGNTAIRKAEALDDEDAADTLKQMALTFNRLGKRVTDLGERFKGMVIRD